MNKTQKKQFIDLFDSIKQDFTDCYIVDGNKIILEVDKFRDKLRYKMLAENYGDLTFATVYKLKDGSIQYTCILDVLNDIKQKTILI